MGGGGLSASKQTHGEMDLENEVNTQRGEGKEAQMNRGGGERGMAHGVYTLMRCDFATSINAAKGLT